MAFDVIFTVFLTALPRMDFLGFVVEEEGPEIGSVLGVLAGVGSIEGVGAGSKIPQPSEDPGTDGET